MSDSRSLGNSPVAKASRSGPTNVADDVLVEIVDDVYLPLLRGRGLATNDARAPSSPAKKPAAFRKRG